MAGVILGILGFVALYIFDIYTVRNQRVKKIFFLVIGVAGIVIGSFLIAHTAEGFYVPSIIQILFGVMTMLFLLLLVYSIVIEVSVNSSEVDGKPSLVTSGTYALSRHPGVVWLFFFYIGLGLALGNETLLYAGVVFTLVNIFYVYLQEKYIFVHLFDQYDQYQKTTPFIIPSYKSIKDFLHKK